jgi:hypothetical protein
MSEASLGTPPAPAPSSAPAQASTEVEKPEGQPTQATDPTRDPSAAPAKPEPTRAEVRKSAAQALRDRLSGKDEGKPDPKPEPKPAAAETPKEGPQRGADGKFAGQPGKEPAAPAKPAQGAPGAPQPSQPRAQDGELEQRLSRTVRELNNATAQGRDHKTKLDATTAELGQLKQKFEAGKANPLDVLEELGWTYEKLTEAIVEQKVKPRAQRMELPPEIKQQLDELKADKEQRTQREQAEVARQQRSRDVVNVKKYIEQQAEQYPFSAALEWAAEAVLDNTMAAKQADALPFLRAFEESLVTSAVTMLGNERAFKALLKSKPELKQSLMAALGVSTSNEADPAASNGAGRGDADSPRSLSNLPSGQSAPPSDKQTKEQRRREAVRAWEQERRRQAAE